MTELDFEKCSSIYHGQLGILECCLIRGHKGNHSFDYQTGQYTWERAWCTWTDDEVVEQFLVDCGSIEVRR